MTQFVGKVQEISQITERGIVVVLDVAYDMLPERLSLKNGDQIEVRNPDGVSVQSIVAGIEHSDPWTPRQLFAFLLPKTFNRDRLKHGAEVWKLGLEAPMAADEHDGK